MEKFFLQFQEISMAREVRDVQETKWLECHVPNNYDIVDLEI